MEKKVNLFWFRRDLRLTDNAGLFHALKTGLNVQCIFIFDTNILLELEKNDARVGFIHLALEQIQNELRKLGSSLDVRYGNPSDVWKDLIKEYPIASVFTNDDWEPYALERDYEVSTLLSQGGIPLNKFKDHVIFRGDELLKADNRPYTVFTPYKKRWLELLHSKKEADGNLFYLKSYDCDTFSNFNPSSHALPTLSELGFRNSNISIPPSEVRQTIIKDYTENRNFPAVEGTSKLGVHFRFGTISIREKARKALVLNDTYLSELIWRDFYSMILYHFPRVCTQSFRTEYDNIDWINSKEEFELWKIGKTGYPIVDAGMRELNQTGYMHNRVRMVVASFLTKHLLIDWRWGEAYFAKKLLDFDLASNNGGWQWAAGCGTDAAPYFRIFNPALQEQKFDSKRTYIHQWVPEINTPSYPKPIVDHKLARERCLRVYKEGIGR